MILGSNGLTSSGGSGDIVAQGGGTTELVTEGSVNQIPSKLGPDGTPTPAQLVEGMKSRGRRLHGAGVYLHHTSWAQAEAERLYGPHNPSCVTDATYNLMRFDWTIGFCVDIWRTAFANSEFWFEGGSDEINSFAWEVWKKFSRKWMHALLHPLSWGRSSSEKMWARRDIKYDFRRGRGEASTLVTKTRTGAFVIDHLRDYDPRSIVLHQFPNGDYGGFRTADETIRLGPEDTVHVTFRKEFGDLRSRPLTHAAYSPWWWGNFVYLGANRYLERKGDPPITGYAPSDKVVDSEGNEQDPIQVTATLAANIRRSANVILPADIDPETRLREYELREMQVAARAEEFSMFATHYEALKALGCLTSPDIVGIGGGAFAKAKTSSRQQHGMFGDAQYGLILDPVNEQIMPQIIRANFGDVRASDMPVLRGGSLSENARDVIAELVKDAQNVVSITKDGRQVPVGSRLDWGRALRQIGFPTIDEDAIPDGIGEQDDPALRPGPGQPSNVKTNPDRPEGPGEKGLSRESDREVIAIQFDRSEMTADKWFADAEQTLQAIDERVNRADQMVEAARLKAEKSIRRMLGQVLREAKKDKADDGRVILSDDNRRLPRSAGREAEEILTAIDLALLDPKDVSAEQFARRTPLAAAHIDSANMAREFLDRNGLPSPRGSRAARVVADVVRDGKTNSLSVPTREGRRIQEQLDRMFQDGTDIEAAKKWVQDWKLPSRDLKLSTVSHVRGSARAMFGHRGVANSPDVGGWVVMTSPSAQAQVLDRFSDGRVSKMMFRTFESGAELDNWFANMRSSTGQAHTSWKNLGLHYSSNEYYVPVSMSLWPAVAALVEKKREDWSKRRYEANQRRSEDSDR